MKEWREHCSTNYPIILENNKLFKIKWNSIFMVRHRRIARSQSWLTQNHFPWRSFFYFNHILRVVLYLENPNLHSLSQPHVFPRYAPNHLKTWGVAYMLVNVCNLKGFIYDSKAPNFHNCLWDIHIKKKIIKIKYSN